MDSQISIKAILIYVWTIPTQRRREEWVGDNTGLSSTTDHEMNQTMSSFMMGGGAVRETP